MKRLILTIISSCAMLFTVAQEEIALDSISKLNKQTDIRQLTIGKPLFSDDSFSVVKINLFDISTFQQPLIPDYNKNLDFLKNLNAFRVSTDSYSITRLGFSPFLATGIVFNQSTYRLNDRFSLGGNSFGYNSVFDQPRLNPAIQNMSTKGASMFLQYKVSKGFKVEGRVSITNRTNPWEQ